MMEKTEQGLGRLCVIGDPVEHSKSPLIQNAMIAKLGIPYHYTKRLVHQGDTQEWLDTARRAAAMEGTVISTGGGIILRPENMEILSATGTVYFLDRDPRDIANTELDGRPLLSGGRDRVFLLYDQRINLYRKYARYTVPSTTVDETVDSVLALVRRGQDVR